MREGKLIKKNLGWKEVKPSPYLITVLDLELGVPARFVL